MTDWNKREYFAALDWASDHHDVAVVNRQGQVVEAFVFQHTGAGWQELRAKLAPYPGVAIAVETTPGAVVSDAKARRLHLGRPARPAAR